MRTKILIGQPVAQLPTGVTVRPVTVRAAGAMFSSRCYFRITNGLATFAFGECSERDVDGIGAAFERIGARRLATMVGGT